MEITIIKSVFVNNEDIPDDLTQEELEQKINEIIDEHNEADDWDDTDWRCKEVYQVYETYSGGDLMTIQR